MKNFDNEIAKWTVLILICIAIFIWASRLDAHHEPTHRRIAIGVPTEIPAYVFVCHTKTQIMQIVKAHEDGGYSAARLVAKKYDRVSPETGNNLCGHLMARIVVLEVLYETSLLFPKGGGLETKLAICKLVAEGFQPVPMYGVVEDMDILPFEDAGLLNAESV